MYTCTARSLEDETRNAELNGNRNPEWWGDFRQLVRIEKIKYRGILRYKFKLRFLFTLNLQLTKISPPFRISITILFSISSLIFHGTGCMRVLQKMFHDRVSTEGWRRPIRCLKLQVLFRIRAINHRTFLRKMTYKDEASYGFLRHPVASLIMNPKFSLKAYVYMYICMRVLQTMLHDRVFTSIYDY